jgi:anaerobic magnesium-protoporphyrin IX monomethyl ester cyclase
VKIRLIEPEPPGVHTFSKVLLPRLGLPLIAAALRAQGHDAAIYAPQMAPVDWADVYSSDLVGISTTTSTATEGYRFADDVRAHGAKVIMGGSHVTFMADEALGHADYVARGEGGELLMLELIEVLQGKRRLETVAGLSFTRDGVAVHNESRGWCTVLDNLPFPDLTAIHGHEKLLTTPIMTSWGCPFNCNFCSVTAMFGRKYRYRSADSVLAEIREKKPKRVFFYDDNLAADKGRLKELLRRMIAEDLTVQWMAQVRTDVVRDDELLDLMKRSGCLIVFLGLESVSQDTLDAYDKHQTVEDIATGIRKLHEHGILSHGMFVLGADSDTPQTIQETVDFALRNRIDSVMLSALTPLPGTPMYEDLEAADRIFDHRWEHYDSHHVVFRPKNMTAYQLQNDVLNVYLRFYSARQWLKALLSLSPTKLLLKSWGRWTIRSWRKDPRNRVFMDELKTIR